MIISPLNNISKRLLLITVAFLFSFTAIAQKNSVKGVVIDTAEKKKLQYAIVALIDLKDTLLYQSIRSNEDGDFKLTNIPAGKYRLMISYPHMADYLEEIVITDTTKKDIGKIPMILEAALLKEVVVRYVPPIRMKLDTLEYTADSFAVKPGANVEELLKRLPGIQVDRNGKITAQGKEVKKVLVDGDEFFSDDPGLATKYLNADAVDKVQVFDKKSDVADFTGIDDGKRTKTINLKLKSNKKIGYFGKVSAAGDAKDYYNHDAMAALFRGPEKMSVFGMASKTGRAGPSYNELMRYVAQDYERIDDGTGRLMFTSSGGDYEPENYYGSGIPSIMSGGAHYSNKWKNDKEKLFSNYRVKHIDAFGWSTGKNTNVLPDGTSFVNNSTNENSSSGLSQKAATSFDMPVDSFSSIKISLNGNWYNNTNKDSGYSDSKNEKGFFVNNSTQSVRRLNDGRSFSANVSYKRQFRKKGRTLSFSLQQDDSRNNSNIYNYAANNYFEPSTGAFKNADTLNQLQKQIAMSKSSAAQVRYSDKFGEHFSVAIEYGWKRADAGNAFTTFNKANGKYDNKIDTLSNDYNFISNTHIAGTTVTFNQKKLGITLGSKFFFTGFKQVNNDLNLYSKRSFINFAPNANVNLTPKQNTQISFGYNGETQQPGVEELQPLRQSSNPLNVQVGNPNLVPSFNHNFSLNYNSYNWAKGRSFYAYISSGYKQNQVTSKVLTDSNNRTISQFINLDGIPSFNGNVNYSWEHKKIHLRPNIGFNFGRYGSYSFLNGVKNREENLNAAATLGTSYDIKDLLTASYSANVNYNIGKSTINNNTNQTWSHSHTIGATVYLPLKLELTSNCVLNFQPKNASFNTSINTTQWDASLTKKVFKNDRGLIKLSVNDILNNNNGYSRSVYGSNVYESNRLVIKRYWMLGFTWNFSKN